jgi:cell cycle sensor histidine kinase DivJ
VRQLNSLSVVEARLAGLVHPSARGDPGERSRHERFLIGRMTAGALALALIPPYLLWRGAPSPAEHLVLAAFAGPLLAAGILARTGLLALAQAVVSAALAAPIVAFAAASGAGAAALLLLLPSEALLSGSRRAAVVAGGVAAASLVMTAVLGGIGLEPSSWPAWLPAPALAIVAVGHGTAALLLRSRHAPAFRGPEESRTLLETMDHLVTWHDGNGHVLEASPAAVTLLGLPPDALRGRGLFSRVHVCDRPAFLRAIGEAAVGASPAVVRVRLHAGPDGAVEAGERGGRKASRVLWVETRAHRIETPRPGAAAPAVIAVTRDISEHRRREEELEEARRQADEADLSKGRLLTAVAGELRAPLNAIAGAADMLAAESAEGPESCKRRRQAATIGASARYLLDLADALGDLAAIGTRTVELALEPLDVAALVNSCCDLMGARAQAAGVVLSCSVVPGLPELVADRQACRRILLNLIANAIAFTPRGGQARVGAARDGDRIVLTVSDTGLGVARSDLPRLGEAFFRATQARGDRDGHGLGLAVVRGLVGLHRGTLTVEGASGEGTSVAVSLPIDSRPGALRPGAPVSVTVLSRSRDLAKVG